MYIILFLIIFILIIILMITLLKLYSTFKIVSVEENSNKFNLEIVNYFGKRYNWTLSKGSDYGQMIRKNYLIIGDKINKFSLHGNYKGFTELSRDKELWKSL